MRIAYLILAHKAPAQLERLLRALAHPKTHCFVHLDLKANASAFHSITALPNVSFLRTRLNVRWGGYSLTQAALEGIREVLQTSEDYKSITLLSGEDYPIKPVEHIYEFISQQSSYSFLEYEPSGSPWWKENESRVTQYHLTEFSFPGRYVVEKILNKVLPRRHAPLPLYGGNMGGWYTLSRAAATYLLKYIDTHPELPRFARYSWGSDEFVVQSVLLNSPFADFIINNNLRYIDWSGGGSSPKVLTISDLPFLLKTTRLFARKFDALKDSTVLDELDKMNN